jgi:hypothetical protein
MAEGGAELIWLLLPPVVGELDHRVGLFIAVADEGQGEFAARIVLAAQQLHAELAGIERDRFVQVEHPDHGVQQLAG